MRATAIVLVCLVTACSRGGARAGEQPFDVNRFITSTLQTTTSELDLGVMAAHRGRLPETRQLGAIIHREQSELQRALTAIAQRRHLAIPADVEPRKRALKENLDILPGQVFDRGYALAMVQDFDAMRASFEKASHADDHDVAAIAKQYLPRINEQREIAAKLLSDLGGSPFS